MARYRINYRCHRSGAHSGQSSFPFQMGGAGDGDATAFAAGVMGTLEAQMTSLTRYLEYNATNRGENHTMGNDKSVRWTAATKVGEFATYRLRNIVDAASAGGDIRAALDANLKMPSGADPDTIAVQINDLARGDTSPAEES